MEKELRKRLVIIYITLYPSKYRVSEGTVSEYRMKRKNICPDMITLETKVLLTHFLFAYEWRLDQKWISIILWFWRRSLSKLHLGNFFKSSLCRPNNK